MQQCTYYIYGAICILLILQSLDKRNISIFKVKLRATTLDPSSHNYIPMQSTKLPPSPLSTRYENNNSNTTPAELTTSINHSEQPTTNGPSSSSLPHPNLIQQPPLVFFLNARSLPPNQHTSHLVDNICRLLCIVFRWIPTSHTPSGCVPTSRTPSLTLSIQEIPIPIPFTYQSTRLILLGQNRQPFLKRNCPPALRFYPSRLNHPLFHYLDVAAVFCRVVVNCCYRFAWKRKEQEVGCRDGYGF